MPLSGRKRSLAASERNMTQEMTAPSSFRVKYWWPEEWAL